jgi:hypothetical protein
MIKTIKKLIAFSAAAIIMFTVHVSALATGESYIRGDANHDGKVTVADVTAIQKKLMSVSVSNFNEKAADVDGNGLKLADAVKIQRYLVGYDNNSYRIGETVYDNYDEYELPFVPVN